MFDRPPIAFATFHFVLKIRVWQKTLIPYTEAKICNGKTKGLALLYENRLINESMNLELEHQNLNTRTLTLEP